MIKPKTTTTVKGKKRLKLLQQRVADLGNGKEGPYLTVGFHAGAVYPDGTSVVKVALWNEFGTEHAPERSFIRSAVRDNEHLIKKWRAEVIINMVTKGWGVEKALATLGTRLVELIKNKIKSDVPPPNAPRTQARKRLLGVPQKTLMETQRLLESVTYQIVRPTFGEVPKDVRLGDSGNGK